MFLSLSTFAIASKSDDARTSITCQPPWISEIKTRHAHSRMVDEGYQFRLAFAIRRLSAPNDHQKSEVPHARRK
jgi:hypothetical protein